MSQPKLVIYLPDFSGGGVPRLYLQLAPGFAESGYDVRFLVDRKRGEMLAAAEALFPVDELNAKRQISALPKLYSYLKAQRPDIMLSAIEQMNIMVILARLFSGVSYPACGLAAQSAEHSGEASELAVQGAALSVSLAHWPCGCGGGGVQGRCRRSC